MFGNLAKRREPYLFRVHTENLGFEPPASLVSIYPF